jgi:hypothetical protein
VGQGKQERFLLPAEVVTPAELTTRQLLYGLPWTLTGFLPVELGPGCGARSLPNVLTTNFNAYGLQKLGKSERQV